MPSSELESLTNRLVTENKDLKCKPLFQKTNTKYRNSEGGLMLTVDKLYFWTFPIGIVLKKQN